jgi:hypothetical protein
MSGISEGDPAVFRMAAGPARLTTGFARVQALQNASARAAKVAICEGAGTSAWRRTFWPELEVKAPTASSYEASAIAAIKLYLRVGFNRICQILNHPRQPASPT